LTLPRPPGEAVAMGNESGVAQAIQLALTPVFLLTAIGGLLNVVTTRLGRVIDRARAVEAELPADGVLRDEAIRLLAILDRRMVLANRAVGLCVAAAVFACILIGTLFVAEATPLHASRFVPPLFVISVSLLTAGLSVFLLEVRIATRTIRVKTELIMEAPSTPGDLPAFYRRLR